MKHVSLRKIAAPAPRLTVWVPLMVAGTLCLVWLALAALLRL